MSAHSYNNLTTPMQRPFDLQKAIAGHALVTRDGRKAKFIAYLPSAPAHSRLLVSILGCADPVLLYYETGLIGGAGNAGKSGADLLLVTDFEYSKQSTAEPALPKPEPEVSSLCNRVYDLEIQVENLEADLRNTEVHAVAQQVKRYEAQSCADSLRTELTRVYADLATVRGELKKVAAERDDAVNRNKFLAERCEVLHDAGTRWRVNATNLYNAIRGDYQNLPSAFAEYERLTNQGK